MITSFLFRFFSFFRFRHLYLLFSLFFPPYLLLFFLVFHFFISPSVILSCFFLYLLLFSFFSFLPSLIASPHPSLSPSLPSSFFHLLVSCFPSPPFPFPLYLFLSPLIPSLPFALYASPLPPFPSPFHTQRSIQYLVFFFISVSKLKISLSNKEVKKILSPPITVQREKCLFTFMDINLTSDFPYVVSKEH